MEITKLLVMMLTAFFMIGALCACGGNDEEEDYDYLPQSTSNSSNRVTRPQISVLTATSTTMEFEVVFKVESEEEPSQVVLYYGRNSGSTTNPKIDKSSTCRYQRKAGNTWYYSKKHAGFYGGEYIYFYGEATNSAGTSKSETRNVIIKRY